MFTNNMRMTGFSGIDVADMVQQMMRAESIRLDRLRQNRDILVWQQQMLRGVAANINTFRNTHLGVPSTPGGANSFRNPANFNVFNAAVTGATGATITAGSAATAGSHTLSVTQTAQAHTFRTGNFNNNHSGATSSGINMAGLMDPENFSANTFERGLSFRMNVNGIAREVVIEASQLNTIFAGADFTDINNIRQQISNHQQVFDDADPALTGTALEAWQTQMTTLRNNLDDAFGALTTEPARGAALAAAMNVAVGATFGHNGDGTQRVSVNFDGQFTFTASQGNTAVLQNSQATGTTGPVGLNTQQLGVSSHPSGGNVNTALNVNTSLQDFLGASTPTTFTLNGITFDIDFTANTIQAGDRLIDRGDQELRIQDLINAVNTSGTGATMSFSALTGQFTLQANQTGTSSAITGDFAAWWNGALSGGGAGTAFAQTQAAQNAEFMLNNVAMSRETNNFTIEGLTVNLSPNLAATITDPAVFEINVSRDLDQVREFIMSFIEEYNNLVGSILDLTETRRPRTDGGRSFFMPLTQEQRRAMSESEITQWEEQARTGLLHRDETLRRITGDLRSSIFMNVPTATGGTVNLVQLGIRSSDRLSDMGRLELRDPAMLDNMLENHLDDVIALFTRFPTGPADTVPGGAHFNLGIAERMDAILRDQLSTNIRGNLFDMAGMENHPLGHNNTMTGRINEQERRIDNMLAWLERRENQLFAQFSRMEVAMMQANSQMMFFDQLFWAQ